MKTRAEWEAKLKTVREERDKARAHYNFMEGVERVCLDVLAEFDAEDAGGAGTAGTAPPKES